ncbi:NAD(P)-dependent dehydrogenase (short-subunit alcohol dehydrogenase family) [Deinococcus budaensis]|uniref:NAD(P)-dependent dehydrogenase (Short-subunit alcohol dehydrogenase family) n=1 Tax=Deinococcus budaensis TaxID=1665626 RepID=A0A7W8GGJ6_9DEIO|nr:glucose 1-dehydrogenase [Deinococcus budaensis]MBB5234818.1 NAD(P)-dependent dehydrogenase (short-subunit alcohol dehydrogenase family) [Deinococcus budaensis]
MTSPRPRLPALPTAGRLMGRVLLVTGGAGGIGRAIALAAAAEGARVVVADVQRDGAEATVAQITAADGEAAFVPCDVADPAQVRALIGTAVGRFGRLDVLVNNAGIGGDNAPAHDLDLAVWDRVLAVNLRGPFLCAREALPHLMRSGSGVIVNVASTYGLIGAPQAPAYCASKGGLVNLTRQLAVDYGPRGVRVNAVCPGYVDTDMGGRRASLPPEASRAANAQREASAARQPLGRQAYASEIAQAVVFLSSGSSSFMTGSIVTVDGGCTATFNHGGD